MTWSKEDAPSHHQHAHISDDILDEVARVLRRPKFGWGQDRVVRALQQISQISVFTSMSSPSSASM